MSGSIHRPPSFAADLQAWGGATALVLDDGRSIQFSELADMADHFAASLPAEVRLLAVEARHRLEALVAYLGALRAGTPVLMHAASAAAIHVNNRYRPDARYAPDAAGQGWSLDVAPTPWAREPHPELALLLSTSGSTGSPKLVRLSARALEANARSIAGYLELTEADRAVTNLPLSYSYGLSVLNSHLAVGASTVLTELSVADRAFRTVLETRGVTNLAGVPHSYELMQRSGLLADLPPTLRTLTQAGGRMSPELVARVAAQTRARLFVMYGQTEATARMAYLPPEDLARHPGAIGRAIPGGELWIEDERGARAALGEVGELVYRGPNVMMGYAVEREDMADPPAPDVLRTGDLAVEIEPGVFSVAGRKSRFVKPFGLRIGLDDLEARCREAGAEVHAAGDDSLVVIAATSPADIERAREALGRLKLPDGLVEFLRAPAAPRVLGGKVDYPRLLQAGREAKARREAGGVEAVEAVAALYRRLAGRAPLVESDSFESLGGDSLSYVQCSIAIEAALGTTPEGWERMPLSRLRALGRDGGAGTDGRRAVTVESDIVVRCLAITLILFQHALDGLQGGADVLMMLAGFSWARFQRARLLSGEVRAAFFDFCRRYLLVYFGIMAGFFALNREIDWFHLLFVSTFRGDWGGGLNTYWFIESLAWCVVAVCVLSVIPAVRRCLAARPTVSGLAFVAGALAIRLAGAQVLDATAHAYRSPDQMLAYFAVGWTVALAGRALRAGLLALLAAISAAAWGWNDTHVIAMGAAGLLMAFVPRVTLPTALARAVVAVAAASFYIYLFNVLPMYVTDVVLDERFGRYWAAQIAASLALGICASHLVSGGEAPLGRRLEVFLADKRRALAATRPVLRSSARPPPS